MVNRTSILSLIVVVTGTGALIATTAQSQVGPPKIDVALQPTTPGTSQSGHSNVSGTSRAGQFVGGGAGLTGLNATNITSGTLNSARLPAPMTLTGSVDFGSILSVSNTSSLDSFGIRATSASGIGVEGQSDSSGAGVRGTALSGTGVVGITNSGTGVYGSAGSTGIAVFGETDNAIGVSGLSLSGIGVKGHSNTGTGANFTATSGRAVWAETSSTNNAAVWAESLATSGTAPGLVAKSNSLAAPGLSAQSSFGVTGLSLETNGRIFSGGALNVFTGGLGINMTAAPQFPIDFSEATGDKISLWGTNAATQFGFGVQANQLQMYSGTSSDFISLGFGGSTSFNETFRFNHPGADFRLRPSGLDNPSQLSAPYDFIFGQDFDNDSSDSWVRFYTNNFLIEQFRIEDGDEAPTRFDGTVNANGIDFAEGFKAQDPSLEPGDLVINSGSNWESIVKSRSAYDTGVIGVVSTRPAFVAGMSFDAEDRMDAELTKQRDEARRSGNQQLEKQLTKQMQQMVKEAYRPVAFMGRVPVKVTGTVKVGDRLAASNIPGVAMALSQAGHSVGIALEASSGGRRTVMAMIQPMHYGGPVASLPSGSGIGAGISEKLADLNAEVRKLRSENQELRERLDRLEQAILSKK